MKFGVIAVLIALGVIIGLTADDLNRYRKIRNM